MSSLIRGSPFENRRLYKENKTIFWKCERSSRFIRGIVENRVLIDQDHSDPLVPLASWSLPIRTKEEWNEKYRREQKRRPRVNYTDVHKVPLYICTMASLEQRMNPLTVNVSRFPAYCLHFVRQSRCNSGGSHPRGTETTSGLVVDIPLAMSTITVTTLNTSSFFPNRTKETPSSF